MLGLLSKSFIPLTGVLVAELQTCPLMWWLLTSFVREVLDWIARKILDWIFRNPGKMTIKQCYCVRVVNVIFNLLPVQSSGAGSRLHLVDLLCLFRPATSAQ